MRILAIDPGVNLGWCTNRDGRLEWGTEKYELARGETTGLRWVKFRNWFTGAAMHRPSSQGPRVDLVVFEKQLNFPGSLRRHADVLFGFTSRIEEFCEFYGIACHPVNVQTLKSFAIPAVKRKKGDPKLDRSKKAMICAAIARARHGPEQFMLTEHEADALHLYWYALEHFITGGQDVRNRTA